MLLFCDSFSHYDTSQIGGKYPPVFPDPATFVTIVPGAGRLGGAAAHFDASLGQNTKIRRALTTASPILTIGCAFSWDTPSSITIYSILVNTALGDIEIHVQAAPVIGPVNQTQLDVYTTGAIPGLSLSTIIILPPGATAYIEVQVNFAVASATLRVSEFAMDYCTFTPFAGTFTGVKLGGWTPAAISGGGESGSWYLSDLYITDGAGTRNTGFLGDIHIVPVLPTADGYNLTTGNTPWLSSVGSGPAHADQLDTPVITTDPGPVFPREMGYVSGGLSSFRFTHPLAGTVMPSGDPFGYDAAGAPYNLIAIQWVAHLQTLSAATPSVAPVIRQIVGGTIPTDTVILAPVTPLPPGILPGFTTYAFACVPYDEDPITLAPWSYPDTLLHLTDGVVGSVEFGIQKIAGVA